MDFGWRPIEGDRIAELPEVKRHQLKYFVATMVSVISVTAVIVYSGNHVLQTLGVFIAITPGSMVMARGLHQLRTKWPRPVYAFKPVDDFVRKGFRLFAAGCVLGFVTWFATGSEDLLALAAICAILAVVYFIQSRRLARDARMTERIRSSLDPEETVLGDAYGRIPGKRAKAVLCLTNRRAIFTTSRSDESDSSSVRSIPIELIERANIDLPSKGWLGSLEIQIVDANGRREPPIAIRKSFAANIESVADALRANGCPVAYATGA